MKIFVKILVLLLLLAVGGAAVFVLSFDADKYKPRIEQLASAELGMRVAINGPLSLGIANLRPAVTAQDVTLGEAAKKETVIEIGSLDIGLPPIDQLKSDPPWEVYLQATNVRVDGTAYGDYESPVTIDAKGGIDIPKLKGNYAGSDVSGELSYKDDVLKADIHVRNLDYAHFTEAMSGKTITIDFDGITRGKNGRQMLSSLRGNLTILGGEGEMAKGGVGFWGGELLTAFLSSGAETTKVNCLVADFEVRDGLLVSRRSLLDTEPIAVEGEGHIDIVDEIVDMKFSPRPKKRAILNISTPMRATGTFDDIKVEPDAMGMATTVGKLILGAANPLTAVVPFVLQDTADQSACEQYLLGEKKAK